MTILALLAAASTSSTGSGEHYTLHDTFLSAQFGLVALGGLLGGLLQPVAAKLSPKASDQSNISFLYSGLLGIAAAGISVYVIAHTKTDEALPLFFFALLCGLGFPAVIASAVDGIGKKTADAQREMSKIADQASSSNPEVVALSSQQLKTTMLQHPADSISAAGKTSVDAIASKAISNIAQTVQGAPESTRDIVEQLKEVATVAQTAGYSETANAAADELAKLSVDKGLNDKDAKLIAKEASERIKGEPTT